MKKLRDIIKRKNFFLNKDGHAVPNEPVTFKDSIKNFFINKDGHAVPNDPISFRSNKSVNESLNEEIIDHELEKFRNHWVNKNDNKHIAHHDNDGFTSYKEIRQNKRNESQKIADHLIAHQREFINQEKSHIASYTDGSKLLNKHLIESHKKNKKYTSYEDQIKHLDSATNNKLKHDLHVYTGVKFHPGEMLKHTKDNIIHLPAYTSTSHHKWTATSFGRNDNNEFHVLHIHAKAGDKMSHVSHVSLIASEYETILPRNTKLKINPKPKIYTHPAAYVYSDEPQHKDIKLHVWHATIHHQD